MWLFFVPKGGILPFHDHPGHTVFSKFFYGKMHLQSGDWESDSQCRVTNDSVITLSDGHIEVIGHQFPVSDFSKGNLHRIHAVEPIAFLDITSPPIMDVWGNSKVKYYNSSPIKNGKVTLDTMDDGDVPQFYGADYLGPKIKEKDTISF
jgi:hypothetical protein